MSIKLGNPYNPDAPQSDATSVTDETTGILNALLPLQVNSAWVQMSIAELLQLTTRPYIPNVTLGTWTKNSAGVIAGQYQVVGDRPSQYPPSERKRRQI